MLLERLEDLSVYYWLKSTFADAPFITITDGFPETDLALPTIAVEAGKIDVVGFELGNRDGLRVRRWYLDIYAVNKAQRDEIGYRLLDVLKNPVPVYNYNEGFPPTVTPARAGALIVESKSFNPIKVSERVVDKLYYRATVSFVAQNDTV